MSCFGWGWIENLLIWLVVICAVVAIVRLLVPFILRQLGEPAVAAGAIILQVLNILIWAIVAIALIIVVFELIGCLIGMPRLRP